MKKIEKYDANAVNRALYEMFGRDQVTRWRVYNLIERVREYEREQGKKTSTQFPTATAGPAASAIPASALRRNDEDIPF